MSVAVSSRPRSEIAHKVIESVSRLTEHRDEQALLRSLLDTILEMLPDAQSSVICVVPASVPGQWTISEACPQSDPVFPISDWLLAEVGGMNADLAPRLVSHECKTYLISALSIQQDLRKAIVIWQPEWSAADLRIAQGVLKIHANYASVLFDSERDTLTGLYNRKKLEQKLNELLANRASGYQRERDKNTADYLAVLDIDHFKRINDSHGHLIGDEVLLIFAGLVRNTLRDVDWVFRYGGEEFIVLIKGVSPATIQAILDRIRVRVQDHAFPQVGQVTVSTGYTMIGAQQLPPHVFEESDKALYYAKEHGRNQVCDYNDLIRRGELAADVHASGSVELFQ